MLQYLSLALNEIVWRGVNFCLPFLPSSWVNKRGVSVMAPVDDNKLAGLVAATFTPFTSQGWVFEMCPLCFLSMFCGEHQFVVCMCTFTPTWKCKWISLSVLYLYMVSSTHFPPNLLAYTFILSPKQWNQHNRNWTLYWLLDWEARGKKYIW